MKPLALAIPICSLALLTASSFAQPIKGGWIVCTRDLQLRETLIDRADENELMLVNSYGIRSVVSIDQVLFMVRSEFIEPVTQAEIMGAPMQERSPVRLITLHDGQAIRGSILESDLPEELALQLIAGKSVHGEAHIPLEHVLRIEDQDAPSMRVELRDDLLIARNGDRFEGFIESIGPSVRMSLNNGSEIEIEAARLASMHIANDPEQIEGVYLTFSDREQLRVLGFVVSSSQSIRVRVDTDSLGLADTGSNEWRFDAGSMTGLRVLDDQASVVALSTLDPSSVEPMGDRVWAQRPTVINEHAGHPALMGLDLHSPVRVSYALPVGATRFACVLEAPIERWTDCVARVQVVTPSGTRTLGEHRLRAQSASAELNLQLPRNAESLVIEIDPGEYGPIQDRVLMLCPRVLIGE